MRPASSKQAPKQLQVTVPATGLNTDLHADAAYRAHLIVALAKRAVTAAG